MTTINPATAGVAASTQSSQARTALTGNFETFLALLTAQLQNQDPLSPLDSKDFTQQLVQYSGVEQQLRTNDLLESLASMTRSSAGATAVSYLGRTATAATAFAGLEATGDATWDYNIPRASQEVRFQVVDSNNRTVARGTGNTAIGDHQFVWDGRTQSGQRAPAGTYRLVVEAVGVDGRPVSAGVSQTAQITGVDMSGASPVVRLRGADVPLSAITRIRM